MPAAELAWLIAVSILIVGGVLAFLGWAWVRSIRQDQQQQQGGEREQ